MTTRVSSGQGHEAEDLPAGGGTAPGLAQGAGVRRLVRAVRSALPLLAVLALAAGLRFTGLDWDRGVLFHPDERRILMVVETLHWPRPSEWSQLLGPRSPLNPRFFAYGSLPIYLLRLLQGALRLPTARVYLPARALSAFYGVLTVAAVYVLGARLGGRRAGLWAAALLAVAVLPIQLAHFATVDTLLALLTTGTVLALLAVAETGSLRAGLVAGVLLGLALATKTSALPLLATGSVAWSLWAIRRDVPALGRGLAGMALSACVAVATYVLAEPYSVLDWFRFIVAQAQESAMARGTGALPYTQQYIGTVPYLYSLRELMVWSLGVPLGLLALAGLVWLSWRGLRLRRSADLVLLAWFWPYFLVVGGFHTKFSRYMAPLIPCLCLAAGLFLEWLRERGESKRRLGDGAMALGAGVLVLTALYALAFAGIYRRPHPWLLAGDWLCREMPRGTVLAAEAWDDPLPARPGPECAGQYRHVLLDLYVPDSPQKLEQLVEALERTDYIVLASQRLYGTIGRLPDRYPLTSTYYRLLFAEKLGFRLVDVRTNYPRLGPIAIVDEPLAGTPLPRPALLREQPVAPIVVCPGRADESYAVYDHPRTLIFRKEVHLKAAQLRALLLGEG